MENRVADIINQMENFASFHKTWAFERYVRLPHKVIGLFTGNQSMKTASTAYQFVMRIFGTHPVPKRNVLYLECAERARLSTKTYDVVEFREAVRQYLKKHKTKDSATWRVDDYPKNMRCPECDAKIILHRRKSRIFRFASQTLPTEKADLGGDTAQSAEINNTQYPEFKKWLPKFLIKKDITVRNPAIIINDPLAGMQFPGGITHKGSDIVVEFQSYVQAVQAGAGVQRMACWCDEEPPFDFFEEQFPRLLVEDGDIIVSVTPANGMCFDAETEILSRWGWKGYKDVKLGDEILTFNQNKRDLELKEVTGLYVDENYTGKMISMKCRGFDALVTPDHRWPILTKPDNKLKVVETKYLKKHHKIFRAIENTFGCEEDDKEYSDWFVELAGWYLTDGAYREKRKQIRIHQSWTANKEKCEKIRKILSHVSKEHYRETQSIYHKGESCEGVCLNWTISGGLARTLKTTFSKRNLHCDFLYYLTKKQQKLLYESLIDGDGCRTKTGDRFRCTKQTADAFQTLCVLLGYKSTLCAEVTKNSTKVYRVDVQKQNGRYKPFTHVCSLDRKEIDYRGVIWCPHTSNDTVVMRKNGTISISSNTWTYDDIFEKAALYIRTKTICEYYEKEEGRPCERYEVTESDKDIAVIQAATDDNPTLDPDTIEESYRNTPDPDGTIVATRRYGIFKQATGRIFKDFRFKTHAINFDTYGLTREGMVDWTKGRSFDFHPANPHAIVWVALSPTNEAFVYDEWNPSPSTWVTNRLCEEIGMRSGFDKFVCNLIDPLANTVNTNTGKTTVEEMNRKFHEMKMAGQCAGAYWEPFATKGEVGRDQIKERLQNSLKCETPFNNAYIEDGVEKFYPTMWVERSLQHTMNSLRHWRLETWVSNKQLTTKDKKETPSEKWSHFCTALEGLFKDVRFKPKRKRTYRKRTYKRFQGRR